MVGLEDEDVLTDFVELQKNSPQPCHIRPDGREIYLSQGDFGRLRGSILIPALADFSLAHVGLDRDQGHLSPIQPDCFRAPEVLLGCPWSYSADIWNLGLLVSDYQIYDAGPAMLTSD